MKVTFQGNPLSLSGHQVRVGELFKNFHVVKNDLSPLSFTETHGVRIFLTVPSLDTPVCDMEVKTFNERASSLPEVTIYTVSMDLPFAQERWCGSSGVNSVVTVSDYKDRSFAEATGTLIQELGLLTRAAFVVDSQNEIVHVEYLDEITEQPDFESILSAAKSAK